MLTSFKIYRPDGAVEERTAELPRSPLYEELAGVIRPLLADCMFDHVSVLHEGKALDMFVDETGALKGLPRNEAATAIYRTAALSRAPKIRPESLPAIYGNAVLFSRRVWF